MAAALAHRGPDDAGIEVIGNVGLVHTRLAIVDPSPAGHEPMRHPERGWWLTYNGEVFNHLELRAELPPASTSAAAATPSRCSTRSPRWGADALPRLNGLFAFAALDPDGRGCCWSATVSGSSRSTSPRHGGALWFASEIGALLAAGVPRVPDARRPAPRARHGWANGPLTPIDGVERVMPGTLLRIDLDARPAPKSAGTRRAPWSTPSGCEALARTRPGRARRLGRGGAARLGPRAG